MIMSQIPAVRRRPLAWSVDLIGVLAAATVLIGIVLYTLPYAPW
jgi:hypothetical protein